MEEINALMQKILVELVDDGIVTSTFSNLNIKTRERILNCLFKQSSIKGPENLNIKIIASEANVSVGSMYQYFGSKENLMQAAIRICVGGLLNCLEDYRETLLALPFQEAMRYYVQGGFDLGNKQRGLYDFYLSAIYRGSEKYTNSVVKPVAVYFKSFIASMIKNGRTRGEVRTDIPEEHLISIVYSFLMMTTDSLYDKNIGCYLDFAKDRKTYLKKFDSFLTLICQKGNGQ